jgi:hypothetical protein
VVLVQVELHLPTQLTLLSIQAQVVVVAETHSDLMVVMAVPV